MATMPRYPSEIHSRRQYTPRIQGEGEIHSVHCRRRPWPERLRRDQIQSKPFSAKPSIVVSSMSASVISLAGFARQAIEPNSGVYLEQRQCRLRLPFPELRGKRVHLSDIRGQKFMFATAASWSIPASLSITLRGISTYSS